MQTSTIQQLKQELQSLSQQDLVQICLRLAKYKKDNKALLDYVLFHEHHTEDYLLQAKESITDGFKELKQTHIYYAKKTVRKILKQTNQYCKYASNKQITVELLLHFCQAFKATGLHQKQSVALTHLYESQLKKIQKNIDALHEDLQYDYTKALTPLL